MPRSWAQISVLPVGWCSAYIYVVPNSVKKSGVCAVMSLRLVHIKEHVWSIGISLTTILLPTISKSYDYFRT